MVKPKQRKQKIKEYFSRDFLNKEGAPSDATISCDVRRNGYQVRIKDCGNMVTLHGSLSNKENRENALYKLCKLSEHILNMTQHIISEIEKKKLPV